MRNAEALSCQELVELVTDYREGVLSAADARAFEEHLDDCPGCREYLEQLEATIRLVGTLTPQDLSPEAEAALLGAFRNWKQDS